MKMIFLLLVLTSSISVAADIPGEVPCGDTPDMKKAQALVAKTIDGFRKDSGKVIRQINDKTADWRDGDLYVFGFEKGKAFAHGYTISLIGQDLLPAKTKDGVTYINSMYLVATTKGSGCVKYQWPNPAKFGKYSDKIAFVSRIENDKWLGVGYYP